MAAEVNTLLHTLKKPCLVKTRDCEGEHSHTHTLKTPNLVETRDCGGELKVVPGRDAFWQWDASSSFSEIFKGHGYGVHNFCRVCGCRVVCKPGGECKACISVMPVSRSVCKRGG